MPIITLQQRHAEQGRIRLGKKVETANGKTRPAKLDKFRFTSPARDHIEALAELYGGTCEPWKNGTKNEFEVFTNAIAIPVIVVKGGFSQWMETWTGGGCAHRCDGEKDVEGNLCDPNDKDHVNAKPTTRLSVMLEELESLGVWRMESHGWNAAAELPSMAEMAMYVGDMVPAVLRLAERSAIVQTAKGPQTSVFVVPTLDLQISKRRLVELVTAHTGGAPVGLEAPDRVAIEAAPPPPRVPLAQDTAPDYPAMLAACSTPDQCRELWNQAGRDGVLDDGLKAAITARVSQLQAPRVSPTQPGGSGAPGDLDELWTRIVAAAGEQGMTDKDLRGAYQAHTGHRVEAMTYEGGMAFLDMLTTGEAPASTGVSTPVEEIQDADVVEDAFGFDAPPPVFTTTEPPF